MEKEVFRAHFILPLCTDRCGVFVHVVVSLDALFMIFSMSTLNSMPGGVEEGGGGFRFGRCWWRVRVKYCSVV
jgi:hypothetical protein